MVTRSRALLVVAAVALGGLLWVGSKQFAPPPPAGDEFAVSGPFTHGNLTVFLLHGPDAERSRPVLGLDEALARQCAVVHETGSVNELTVENTSEEDDLLLLSGDIVKGGRQDRVLQATMILPPKSGKVPVRSFCVEQSRWTKRGVEDDKRFAANPGQIAGKELKNAVQLAGSQGEVWSNVKAQQGKLSGNLGVAVNNDLSPTSLQLAMENDKVQSEVAKFRETITSKVGDRAGVVGFVTVVNGQVTGAEAFASHALFQKAWAKAVNSAAVEAVAAEPNRTFTPMTTAGVRSFLARAEQEQVLASVDKAEPVGAPDGGERDSRTRSIGGASNAGPAGIARIDSLNTFDLPAVQGRSGATRERVVQTGGTNDVIAEVNALPELQLALPSPTPLNPSDPIRVNLARSVQNRGRAVVNDYRAATGNLQNAADNLSPQRNLPAGNTAVVEYREPGNGAVIHKSFLVK